MSDLPDILSKNPVFSELPQPALHEITQSAIQRKYAPQEILVHQGEFWPYLFITAQGEINAVKESPGGRALIATTITTGEVFWGLAFFIKDEPMPVMLQANNEARVYMWRREQLAPVIQEHGTMSWYLCRVMINRMQHASDIVEDLAFQPVTGRLAGLLLDIFEGAEGDSLARSFTLDEMAARIGSTREMVCRHLYRFAEKGAIEISRTELKIMDKELLEEQTGK